MPSSDDMAQNDLTVSRMLSNNDGEQTSFNAESYNSWRYGEEASLYSIAEDSREDRQSEALSRAGTEASSNCPPYQTTTFTNMPTGLAANDPYSNLNNNPWDDDQSEDNPVEVKWVTDIELDDAQSLAEKSAAASLPPRKYRRGNKTKATDRSTHNNNNNNKGSRRKRSLAAAAGACDDDAYEQSLGYQHNERPNRRIHAIAFALCAIVVGLVVAVAFALTNKDNKNTNPTVIPKGLEPSQDDTNPTGTSSDVFKTTPQPVPSPTLTPTSRPTPDYEALIAAAARKHVRESLTACPYTDETSLSDFTLPQAEVYEELILSVQKETTVDRTTDEVILPDQKGQGYLLERWALLMLFFNTKGEFWSKSGGWYTDEDVCDWEANLKICTPRVNGGGAITYLDLHDNGLQGEIPRELCCMPLLKKLYLYSNRLSGVPPACLEQMGLEVLDLSNNMFPNVDIETTYGIDLP